MAGIEALHHLRGDACGRIKTGVGHGAFVSGMVTGSSILLSEAIVLKLGGFI